MARTSLHIEVNYVKPLTPRNQRFQATTSDFDDILQIAKCTVHSTPQTGMKKKSRGKMRGHNNYLEIIPETSSLSTTDAESINISNNNSSDLDNRMGTKCDIEDCDTSHNVGGNIISELHTGSRLGAMLPMEQLNEETELITREPIDNPSTPLLQNTFFNWQVPVKRSFGPSSTRSQLELKSGALVWISQRHCSGSSINLNRDARRHQRLDSNNNDCYSTNSGASDSTTLRTPVMLKVHRSSAGDFALLTPSRSCQNQTQPLYLRLKHSHAALDDVAAEASTSRAQNSGPCCFHLTLGGMEGKSFKFEASSRDAALAWVNVLSRDYSHSTTAFEFANGPCLSPSFETEDEESINDELSKDFNSCHQSNTDDKNNNYSSHKLENMNNSLRCSAPLSTANKHSTDQICVARQSPFSLPLSNYYPSALAGFQRDRVMPTLSESSDEDYEDS